MNITFQFYEKIIKFIKPIPMENSRLKFTAHMALIAMTIIYAYNYYISSFILEKVSGYELTLLRAGFAAIAFTIIDTIRLSRISKHPLAENTLQFPILNWKIITASILMSLSQVLFFEGLKETEPVNAAIMQLSTPIIVFLIASALSLKAILHKEKFNFFIQIVGVFIAILGAFHTILVNSYSNSIITLFHQSGDFIVLSSAALFGIYTILLQQLIKKGYHFVSLLKWNFIIGTGALLFLGFIEVYDYSNVKTIVFNLLTFNVELSFFLQVSYLLFLATILTFIFNISALKVLSPTVVSTYNCLQPLVAAIIGLSLGQKIDAYLIVTGFLVILGVIMVSKSKWIELNLTKRDNPILAPPPISHSVSVGSNAVITDNNAVSTPQEKEKPKPRHSKALHATQS